MINSDYSTVRCLKCQKKLKLSQGQREVKCGKCDCKYELETFPALYVMPKSNHEAEELADLDQSSCFYHETNAATVACDHCGRFLCSLCAIDFGMRTLCPGCIEAGRMTENSEISELNSKFTRYDRLALSLALIPVGVTALVSLYLAIKHWTTPISLVSTGRTRWIISIVVAVLNLAFCGFLVSEVVRAG